MLNLNDRGLASSVGIPPGAAADPPRDVHAPGEHRTRIGPALAFGGDRLDRLSDLFRLLSDKTRLTLLQILGDGERNVTALCGLLGLPQPTVSHHLGLLRQSGLITPRRSGKQVFYRLADCVGSAIVARNGVGGVDLDGSTHKVGRHPDGFQVAVRGFIVQIVTGEADDSVSD